MNKNKFINDYWRFYKLLEKEFVDTIEYVEVDTSNMQTFSMRYEKILIEVGAELDTTFKMACNLTGRKTIVDYAPIILNKYPDIIQQSVTVLGTKVKLQPYQGWNSTQASQSLMAWKGYNLVKHDRISNYRNATLENAVNLLAALFILLMYEYDQLYKGGNMDCNIPEDESGIFILDSWEQHIKTSNIYSEYSIFDDETGI